jgi:hypothetical protein
MMKLTLAGVALLLWCTGCGMGGADPGPTQSATQVIDGGKAETVRMEINMNSGELRLESGAVKLMSASFRYSENIGRPEVRYDVAGGRGVLTLQSPKTSVSFRNKVNEWDLRMGSQTPLDINVRLGGGTANIDMSGLLLQAAEVDMGAGEMQLNLAGHYAKDVPVQVNGGAGEARITLPKDIGAVVEASVGIGGINTTGLTKRDDGKYYNDAYAAGKPAVRLEVHGGVGDITLSVAK